jgi:hypothetical protein
MDGYRNLWCIADVPYLEPAFTCAFTNALAEMLFEASERMLLTI